ncbi:hypothetical protein [Corallococcus sp. EGB]|nr:hypothetical protein [Corallococcus sp. EGB]
MRSPSFRCWLFAAWVLWAVHPSVARAQAPAAPPVARHAQVDALFAWR